MTKSLKEHDLNNSPRELVILPLAGGKYSVVEKFYSRGKRPGYTFLKTFNTYQECVALINTMR